MQLNAREINKNLSPILQFSDEYAVGPSADIRSIGACQQNEILIPFLSTWTLLMMFMVSIALWPGNFS